MWTAKVTEVVRSTTDKRAANATVIYTDGSSSETHKHDVVTETDLQSVIEAQLARYNAIDKLITDLPIGDVVVPSPKEPSDDERARSAFFDDWKTYRGYRVAIAAELMTADDAIVRELFAKLAAAFRPEYARSL